MSGTRKTLAWAMCCLFFMIALCSVSQPAAAQTSTVTYDRDACDNVNTKILIGISGTTAEVKFRDLHLQARNDPPTNPPERLYPVNTSSKIEVFKKDGEGNYTVKVGELKVETSLDGSVHLTVSQPSTGLPDGDYAVTIPWKGAPLGAPTGAARICVTHNGGMDYKPSDRIGPEHTPTNAYVPTTYAAIFGPPIGGEPAECATGATTQLSIVVDEELTGRPFEVYSSVSLNPEYQDEFGIGINSVTEPVPGSWGLLFGGFSGTVSPVGGSVQPVTVAVPPDPSLVGRTFYVVLAVKDPAGEICVVSRVLTVVIQPGG